MIRSLRLLPLVAVALLGASACSQPAPPPAPPSDSFVLNNVTVIDGNGGAPLANAAIVVTDGRIAWVGPAAQLQAPQGAPIQDLSGKFVMPGIIDLHTHVAESDGIVQDPKRTFTRENVERELTLYATYGVTSVASMGTDQPVVYEIRAEQRAGRPRTARIFTAGRGFTTKGGYPTQPGGIAGVPYEVSTPEEVAADIKDLATHKPDLVKQWVDDHFGALPKIPIALSKAIIDGAHANNIKAVAHLFYLQDAKALSAAGLDGFMHAVRDRAVDDALIASMKEHGTWQVASTLAREASMFSFAGKSLETYVNDPFFTRAVQPNVLEVLRAPAYQDRFKADKHFPEYPRYLRTAQQNLKRLADAGVRYGFGTDAGPPSRFGGFGEHWELALMVEAGLTPMQVLTAATKSGAEFLGATDLGTIESGKWADLLVLDANPLDDIKNSRQINSVYVAGNKVQ